MANREGTGWWTPEQALALMSTGSREFATSDEVRGHAGRGADNRFALMVTFFCSDRGTPVLRSPDDALAILTKALQRGRLKVTALTEPAHSAANPMSERQHLQFRADTSSGEIVLATTGRGAVVAWRQPRLLEKDVLRIAAEASPSAGRARDRQEWRAAIKREWLPLADAVRFHMQITNDDGERLALEMCAPVADHNASEVARAVWERSKGRMLGLLESGAVGADAADVGAIPPADWSRAEPDWWASSLGNCRDIRVRRADVEQSASGPGRSRMEAYLSSQAPALPVVGVSRRATKDQIDALYAKGVAWAKDRVAEGSRIPSREFKARIRKDLGIKSPLAQQIWEEDGVLPDEWKKRGRRRKHTT